ncbi:hypothetical protein [Paenibacillus sp. MBLB4367]|uniref:hypothetical protein n=1 Tax=Paenibacillus sp. MBLB4367 TaxID=3384767 RepID=UPI003907F252
MKRSHKMIAAGIALTLALGGGAAYAASDSTSAPSSADQQQSAKQGKGEVRGKFAAEKGVKIGVQLKQHLSIAADALGIEESALRTELEAGKSLADVAQEKGVAVDTVIAALTKELNAKIDKTVEAGKLTAEQAATAKEKAAAQAKQAVEQKGLPGFGEGGRGHGKPGGEKFGFVAVGGKGASLDKAAEVLGLSVEDLKKELKADKSLADVAKEKGIAVDTLTAALIEERNAGIDKTVEAGKLTAEQAVTVKEKIAEQVKQAVEQKGLKGIEGDHGRGFGPGPGKMGGALGIHAPLDKVAEIVGLSVDDLKKELEGGKSIADIAQEKGISKDQLIAKLQELTKPALEKFVDQKGGFKVEMKKKIETKRQVETQG